MKLVDIHKFVRPQKPRTHKEQKKQRDFPAMLYNIKFYDSFLPSSV